MDDERQFPEIEEVQSEVRESIERARELLCEVKLALRLQQPPPDPPIVLE
jgi:hypothetical protein